MKNLSQGSSTILRTEKIFRVFLVISSHILSRIANLTSSRPPAVRRRRRHTAPTRGPRFVIISRSLIVLTYPKYTYNTTKSNTTIDTATNTNNNEKQPWSLTPNQAVTSPFASRQCSWYAPRKLSFPPYPNVTATKIIARSFSPTATHRGVDLEDEHRIRSRGSRIYGGT